MSRSAPSRDVVCGDGVTFIREREFARHEAVFTSMPDVSEMGGMPFEEWRAWFTETARLVCERVHTNQVAAFYQTDIKKDGGWVDKAHLVHLGADAAGARLLWHKIVCRVPAGRVTFGRPAFAHLLCFSRASRLHPGASTADVLPELGEMTWARAMGAAAALSVARFLKEHAKATTLIDPFCGVGTALAAANAVGLDAIGVELSRKRAARAQQLSLRPILGSEAMR